METLSGLIVSNSIAACSAVQDLYRAHHGWLQSWLSKKLGSSFDAADLAQDTFLRVLGRRGAEIQWIGGAARLFDDRGLRTRGRALAASLARTGLARTARPHA